MVLKNLLGRKMRTLLTTLGIAIGVAAVVALGALADGFIQGYGAIAGGSGADLLVVQEDALDIVFSAVDQDVRATLEGFSDVTQVAEMIYTFAETDSSSYFIVYGYEPDSFAMEHFKIVEGTALTRHGSGGTRAGRPLILGHSAADDLGKHVGDTFRLAATVYRIVGIYETGEPFEDGAAVILLEDAQVVANKPREVNAFLLKVRSGADLDQLRARIERRFDDLTASRSADFVDQQDMLQYIYVFTWTVSLVAILIGGVGVMNTMLMSVFERTREIGVLRAVGWRPGRVLRMILGESFVLSLLGGGVGILLGVWGMRAMESDPTYGAFVSTSLSPALLVQGSVVALGLGLLGGGLPAWRASRLMPAEAMRYDGAGASSARHVRSSALRNIMRQPVRTLLTVVGIGIAMMAMILLGAMGAGMMDAVTGIAVGMGANLVGSQTNASMDLSRIDEQTVRRIATLPGVQTAEGFLTSYTVMGDLPFFIVFGYQPRGLGVRNFTVIEGSPLTTNRQMLLGRVAAENLDKEVGQSLRLFNQAFKIVGIYETGVPFQDGGCVVSLRDAQKIFGQAHKVSFVGVWLSDLSQADAIERDIEARFPDVALARASDFTEGLSDLQMMEAMTWAIALMALFVGGLGMTNTMVMSVFERTREIGVLRALGWSKRRILGMIVRESVVLSLLGGVTGGIMGVLLGYGLNLTPAVKGFMRLTFTPELFLQTFMTALILGVIGGVYPAWRASNLQPVEALRYE
ncbi:MAG: ABC transporter permease [Anaerolineae bacterium]|nr:ABC transporter permease [Anaerolineae bacterium]